MCTVNQQKKVEGPSDFNQHDHAQQASDRGWPVTHLPKICDNPRRSWCATLMAVLVWIGCWVPTTAEAADVVIVKSNELAAYDKAIAGFRDTFKGSIEVILIQGTLSEPANLTSAVKEKQPKAILAVGLRAANALRTEITDIPIVFCMAAHPSQNKLRTGNMTGVDLEPHVKDQLRVFREVIPRMKKLAVIYDPKRSGKMVEDGRKAASELGITLVEKKITEKKEVLDALKGIESEADSLWLIRDATVLTREFFQQTLLVQVEKKIPVVTYSDQFVRKGAVCSYASDYQSQGKKAAQVIQSILEGAKAGDMVVQTPDGTLVVNINSAAKANVTIPPAVLQRPGVVKVSQ